MKSYKEHAEEAEILEELKLMKSPIALFAVMAKLNSDIKGTKDEDTARMNRKLAHMIWVGSQMQFSFLGAIEKNIEQLSKEMKRLK